jgi:hypothetical protein
MSEERVTNTNWNPFFYNPVTEFLRATYPSAPPKLDQPILPGWSFGNIIAVSANNSSSPDTERRIVSQHSYGRQIGHLMDAMCDLIGERPESLKLTPAMERMVELKEKIETIKCETCEDRIEQLKKALAAVKQKDPREHKRLSGLLRAVLEDGQSREE